MTDDGRQGPPLRNTDPGGSEEVGNTYVIRRDARAMGGRTIQCLRCEAVSFYDGDVEMRYCARCDWMHLEGRPRSREDHFEYVSRAGGGMPVTPGSPSAALAAMPAERIEGHDGTAEQLPHLPPGSGVIDAYVICMKRPQAYRVTHFLLVLYDLDAPGAPAKELPEVKYEITLRDLTDAFSHDRPLAFERVFPHAGRCKMYLQLSGQLGAGVSHVERVLLRLVMRELAEDFAEGHLPPIVLREHAAELADAFTAQVTHYVGKHFGCETVHLSRKGDGWEES